jgi:uncharacterized 2Fe-2S/4Fe-4S cluster protein (DUF4445 family)
MVGPDKSPILACQFSVKEDIEVTIPQASQESNHQILVSGTGQSVEVCPSIQPTSSTQPVYGVACDIGTTTVVARLMDLRTGGTLATAATINPQARHGFDVISRIHYGSTDHGLRELQGLIVSCLNDLIEDLCMQAGVDQSAIHELCVVGNTTMNHLFLGLPVAQLGQAPYAAFSVDAHDVPPADLGIRINPAGNVHTVENIAGFVGADTTAVAVAVEIGQSDQVTLVLDIGTNGELLLAARGKVHAASCAAGPAFEGARISQGSRAVGGAIERVGLSSKDIEISVIGNTEPHSICGSGLVDAVAVLLDLGLLDATGRLAGPAHVPEGFQEAMAARVIEVARQPAWVLAWASQGGRSAVILTQADIRQVQLAKAAIRAGIELLLRKTGLESSDIEQVLLAGAFGNTIRPAGAIRIGLLPEVPVDRVISVGNAACAGAEMILLNRHCRIQAGQLARSIRYVEIATDPAFEQAYPEAMSFPVKTEGISHKAGGQ